MRQTLSLLGMLWFASFATAAPAELADPGGLADAAEARNYAVQLYDLATTISQTYVRPVARVQLLAAAVEGLYEEARCAPPAGLRAELAKQIQDAAEPADPPPPGVVDRKSVV